MNKQEFESQVPTAVSDKDAQTEHVETAGIDPNIYADLNARFGFSPTEEDILNYSASIADDPNTPEDERLEAQIQAQAYFNLMTGETILRPAFNDDGTAVLINGNLDLDIRNKNINRFKTDEKVRFLIATYGTAKEGLTLTVANHAIFFERNFSLSDYLQAQDRIHRISQKKKSFIYNIYTKDSAEDWLEALVSAKESAAKFVQGDIDEDEFTKKIRYDYGDILEKILN